MGERFSGYSMPDRITDPVKAKPPQFTGENYHRANEQMKTDIKADIAARPPKGSSFDSEDSDALVMGRLSEHPRFLPPTEDIAAQVAKDRERNERLAIEKVRSSFKVIEGGKPAPEIRETPVSAEPQEKTG